MYKSKPHLACHMPGKEKLRVLALNASLKHAPEISNTEELTQLVVQNMGTSCEIASEIIRLSDVDLPVGLGFRESQQDAWPGMVDQIKTADIVIFATPVWWGGRSSLMQRIIERLDALDEEYHASGRIALYNKVAGIVVTGSEDGALHVMGTIMMVLTWMGFTLPPECCAYWVGEVGFPPSQDRDKRLKSQASATMAKTWRATWCTMDSF